jgi:hypothetical protein
MLDERWQVIGFASKGYKDGHGLIKWGYHVNVIGFAYWFVMFSLILKVPSYISFKEKELKLGTTKIVGLL